LRTIRWDFSLSADLSSELWKFARGWENQRARQSASNLPLWRRIYIPSRFWPVSNFFFCCRAEEGKDWTECKWRDIAERRRRRAAGRQFGLGHNWFGDAGPRPGSGCRGPAKAKQAEHPRRQGSSQEADLVRQWVHSWAGMSSATWIFRVSRVVIAQRKVRRNRLKCTSIGTNDFATKSGIIENILVNKEREGKLLKILY